MTSIRKRLESESLTIDIIKWFYTSYGNIPLCCNTTKGNKIKCESFNKFLSKEAFNIQCLKCQNYIKTQLYKRLFDYSEITFKGFYAHNKQIHAKSFVTDIENILALNYNEALKDYYSNICLHEIVEISLFRVIEQINDSLRYNEHVSNLTHYLTCLSLNQYLTIPLKPLTKYATHDFLAFDFKPSGDLKKIRTKRRFLYHGTNTEHLKRILKDGFLKPSGITKNYTYLVSQQNSIYFEHSIKKALQWVRMSGFTKGVIIRLPLSKVVGEIVEDPISCGVRVISDREGFLEFTLDKGKTWKVIPMKTTSKKDSIGTMKSQSCPKSKRDNI